MIAKEFGTISFDIEFMRELIGIGGLVKKGSEIYIDRKLDPHTIQLGLWLSYVPEIYKAITIKVAENIYKKYIYEHATDMMLLEFIHELRRECINEIRNRAPSSP
jgi:hypothetical protein